MRDKLVYWSLSVNIMCANGRYEPSLGYCVCNNFFDRDAAGKCTRKFAFSKRGGACFEKYLFQSWNAPITRDALTTGLRVSVWSLISWTINSAVRQLQQILAEEPLWYLLLLWCFSAMRRRNDMVSLVWLHVPWLLRENRRVSMPLVFLFLLVLLIHANLTNLSVPEKISLKTDKKSAPGPPPCTSRPNEHFEADKGCVCNTGYTKDRDGICKRKGNSIVDRRKSNRNSLSTGYSSNRLCMCEWGTC